MAILIFLLFLLTLTTSHSIPHPKDSDIQILPLNTTLSSPLEPRQGIDPKDPSDFSWVQRWAAIGDSFTAGIGSGNLYSKSKGDRKCSRYDRSYPALLEREFGPAVKDFQYLACSGDRTSGIYVQALTLSGEYDLVVLTAGGNDLCLADIILTCIFLPFQGEKKCQEVLDKAQENIETILKPNIREVLRVLNSKVRRDGIVVYPLYAQFFDTSTDKECVDQQNWAFPSFWFTDGLKLTTQRRLKFNTLVQNINAAIKDVITEFRNDRNIRYRITHADWDPWPREAVKGQFCVPGTTGEYPDPKQPDLHFFRPDTRRRSHVGDELKRRDFLVEESSSSSLSRGSGSGGMSRRTISQEEFDQEIDIYNSLLYKSVNPAAAVINELDPSGEVGPAGEPQPAKCPGDGRSDRTFGYGLPDRWGKFFHPNELGHVTIASFAMEAIIAERAAVLGVDHPICRKVDEFRCWNGDDTGKRYVDHSVLSKTFREYCSHVKPPKDFFEGWTDERVFYEGTTEAHKFTIRLAGQAHDFVKEECLEAFERIIDGCPKQNDPDNTRGWKFGGRYTRGAYTYELSMVGSERPWPMIKDSYGKCEGNYRFLYSRYTIYGAGWASWDHGDKTLRPSIIGCVGLGVTDYKLKYFDKPDKNGYEWKATFNTPVMVRSRCFKNNKVARNSGGRTNGCRGSDV